MMSLFTTFAAADLLSFSVCIIVLFGFCAGIILLNPSEGLGCQIQQGSGHGPAC